jgi:iron complex outermembrane receptor protein
MRINAGKSFRCPNAIELSSNGIHHGSFRHETGNPNLKSEEGYYMDGNVEWSRNSSLISLSSYLYYFTNYIFLNPTGDWSILPDGGQIYEYTQSKAMLSGVEIGLSHKFRPSFIAEMNLEYIYNKQINEDASLEYPLPFTPPLNGYIELNYLVSDKSSFIDNTTVFLHSKFALEQQRISRNEETTEGFILFGIGMESTIYIGIPVEIVLRLDNIFNTKYFNHISFYRKLNIPEQGRNIQIHLKLPLNINPGK